MSSRHQEKLKNIRIVEGLSQAAFAELTGINIGTIKNYEAGKREAGIKVIDKIISIDRFKKYTMWLMLDETNPALGQIAPSLSGNQASKVKSDGAAKNAEEVVTQISSQQPDMQAIISSLSNLDDDELKQLSKLLSRRGAIFLLELLDQDNQELIGLDGGKKQAALQLKSMNKEQVREILSKIEGNNKQFTEVINDFTEKAS